MKPAAAYLQARKPGQRRPLIIWVVALVTVYILGAANELQWPATPMAWVIAGCFAAAFALLWLYISCSEIEEDPEELLTPLQQRLLAQRHLVDPTQPGEL